MIKTIRMSFGPDEVSQNAVCETNRLALYQKRGERLLMNDDDRTLYDRYVTQTKRWKGDIRGEQLEGLLVYFGSMKNSSLVRQGIKTLIERLENTELNYQAE